MKNKKPHKKSNNSLKKVAQLTGIAAQMGITIFLGATLGKWLDKKYPSEKNWFTLIFILLGVAISLYSVLKQVNKINNEDK